jgi:hypothetical protein
MLGLTDFHAKYFAHELRKRSPSDSVEMLAGVLADTAAFRHPTCRRAGARTFGVDRATLYRMQAAAEGPLRTL